jgi:hypothetical protein
MRRALCEEEMGDMRRSAARRGKQLEEERLFSQTPTRRALCKEESGDMRRAPARRGKVLEEERILLKHL